MITTLLIVKVTVALALAFAGIWITQRSRAALRHSLLAAAFGAIALLPVVSLVAPTVNLTAPVRVPEFSPSNESTPRGLAPVVVARSQQTGYSPVAAVWIAGIALAVTPMLLGLWRIRTLGRSATPWGERFLGDRRIVVMLHESIVGPMTFGWLHPRILLPAEAQNWDEDDLNRALEHELEHVRRNDWLTHCLARSICAFYWFHPFVWIAWRRLELEAERSCDDAVLGKYEATAYADQLVALAQRLSNSPKSAQLAMANRADLASRVHALLDGARKRGRLGKPALTLALAVAAGFVVTLSPLRIVGAQSSSKVTTVRSETTTVTTDSTLVKVDISVKDNHGAPIENLKPEDFVLTEDGVVQHIATLEFQKMSGSQSSYYVLGYYTSKSNKEGPVPKIKVALNKRPAAKVEQRIGDFTLTNGVQDPSVTPPVVLYAVEPEFSEEARKAKHSGTVILSVVIDASGRIDHIKVIQSLGPGFDEKAMEAVAKWRFKPATKDGQAIAVRVPVEFGFRLTESHMVF